MLEVVGKANAVPEGVEMLGNGGTYALVGCICAGDLCSFDPAALVLPGKNVLGIMWYDAPSLLFSLEFLAKHKARYPFHKLISHRYPLSEINDAMATQDAGLPSVQHYCRGPDNSKRLKRNSLTRVSQ